MGVALAAVLALGCEASGGAASAAPAPGTAGAERAAWGAIHVPIRSISELAVMSFNVRHGEPGDEGAHAWPSRAELVFAIVREHRPDVLVIQEATLAQLDALLEAAPEYAAIGVGRTDGMTEGELVAILVRAERLVVEDRGAFWLSERPGEPGSISWGAAYPRVCAWAVLRDAHHGQRLAIYGTHLDHRSADARAHGLELIARHVRERERERGAPIPTIVAGDLNLPPGDPALAAFLAESGLVDTYRAAHPEIADDEATYHAFRGETRGERVDFVLATPDARVMAAEIVRTRSADGRFASDHFPVTTTIRIARTE